MPSVVQLKSRAGEGEPPAGPVAEEVVHRPTSPEPPSALPRAAIQRAASATAGKIAPSSQSVAPGSPERRTGEASSGVERGGAPAPRPTSAAPPNLREQRGAASAGLDGRRELLAARSEGQVRQDRSAPLEAPLPKRVSALEVAEVADVGAAPAGRDGGKRDRGGRRQPEADATPSFKVTIGFLEVVAPPPAPPPPRRRPAPAFSLTDYLARRRRGSG